MNAIKAVVRDGRIEPAEPIVWPEGTEVVVSLPGVATLKQEEWDNSPEAISAWLRWYDSLEPLILTDEELRALEADRRERKKWEKAHFDEHAAKLESLWE